MSATNNPTCSSCRWWEDPNRGYTEEQWPMRLRSGICRRNAPTVSYVWPNVQSGDWCGEHAPRGDVVPALPDSLPLPPSLAPFVKAVGVLLQATDDAKMDVNVDRAAIAVREAFPPEYQSP